MTVAVAAPPLVRIRGLGAAYGRLEVLRGIDLDVREGEFLGVIGHNGAGKSTLLKVIAGILPATRGSVEVNTTRPVSDGGRISERIAMVPQGLAVFPRMTVAENLEVPRVAVRNAAELLPLGEIYELFPVLRERGGQTAGTLSGGEQRMVAIGMALRLAPRLLLLDEPSLGLAPKIAIRITEAVDEVRRRLGSTVVVVEQNLDVLLRRAERLVAIRQGAVVWEGDPGAIGDLRNLWQYF